MVIKVLGSGCTRCDELERRVINSLSVLGVAADVQKVKDIKAISSYGVLGTPALIIGEKIKVTGRVPSEDEIKKWIQEQNK